MARELEDVVRELEDANLRVEYQVKEVANELRTMVTAVSKLSQSVEKMSDLVQKQIKLDTKVEALEKRFDTHDRESEKILTAIHNDIEKREAQCREVDRRISVLELEMHDNTTARKIGQWLSGLAIAAFITYVTWKLK